MILTLPVNEHGRDFVCGDIHGSYSCVARFLTAINFDFTNDRLICVGDLFDRGPENERCLMLVHEPWFYTAMGNHEDLAVGAVVHQSRNDFNAWMMNGGKWFNKHSNGDSEESATIINTIKTKMEKLPLIITVNMKNGKKFHVMHAEILPTKPLTDEDFEDENEMLDHASRQTSNGSCILWGRYRFLRFYKKNITKHDIDKAHREAMMTKLKTMFNDKLSHVYSGHTPLSTPLTYFGQTNLDTMAYSSYEEPDKSWGLTVTEPASGKFWCVSDNKFEEVKPIIIS